MHVIAKYFPVVVGIIFLCYSEGNAQLTISGKVYDSSGINPISFVSIITNTGQGTVTDILGQYEIKVSEKDTIWFSYLEQRTNGFPVRQIWSLTNFDISLKVSVPVLKEVRVQPGYYRLDSIENRSTYSKIFNYKRPTLGSIVTSFGLGVTIDINELIHAFEFEKIRKNLKFQRRLIQEEKEKFVSHRFSKQLVIRLTGLQGSELDSFMTVNRPTYQFPLESNDYEFREYIKKRWIGR